MALIRKWLILSHRYLGIALGLLFVIWFASGIGMMYAGGMPRLTEGLRVDRLEPLDFEAVRMTPWEVAELTGPGETLGRVTLLTVVGRPAYRLDGESPATVFADTGESLDEVGPTQARRVAGQFVGLTLPEITYERLVTEADQWTITQRAQLPLHKLNADDEQGTQLYVSPASGEVTLLTTRASRALAWVAAIPHWLYFTPLRIRATLWRHTILWTAGLGCVLAIFGIALAFLQFRFSPPFRWRRVPSYLPYSGWMRWHYIAGAVFGLFALTWVFSGLLSMEPWGWASREGLRTEALREALIGGPLEASAFPAIDSDAWDALLPGRSIKEVIYTLVLGEPYFMIGSSPVGGDAKEEIAKPVLVSAKTLEIRREPFAVDTLVRLVRETSLEAAIVEARLLEAYDSYHYSRDNEAPLPILRVKFDDPERTWLYLDPTLGELSTIVHRLDRVERWIYNGFHSLDFSFWYYNRRIWEIGVLLLSLGGLATSAIGLFVGTRRLWRAGRPRSLRG